MKKNGPTRSLYKTHRVSSSPLVNDPSPADVRALNFEIANVTNYAIESSPHNDTGLTGARSDRLSSGEYPLHYDIAARQLFLSITVKIQPILSGLQV